MERRLRIKRNIGVCWNLKPANQRRSNFIHYFRLKARKMPLLLLCGYPSSGKSTRAQDLKRLIETLLPNDNNSVEKVEIVDYTQLGHTDTVRILSSANEEKKARGSFMAAVNRHLNNKTIVIGDAWNYTKSERYQLYCMAREHSSTYCLVHIGTAVDTCKLWNSTRNENQKLPETLFDEMVNRFEVPKPLQRWDSPLFTIMDTDADRDIPIQKIYEVLIKGKPSAASQATITNLPSSTDYLYLLNSVTQRVIGDIMTRQRNGEIVFEARVGEHVSMPELARLKRKFVSMQQKIRVTSKTQSMMSEERVIASFMDFIASSSAT
eukprot:Partr_v1_DN28646_c1_g1_i5_m49951 putative KTI12 homolog, chromatin associated (S. cerevisiae)